ncbi:sideroflexin-2-like isoform X2 [Rhopilema esculentum]|uniref:sideroflexin-2-like isoform X2 n=1 Tax=Rhopilema esculentum TaxID=499914 RepID=UPI0031CFF26B
MEWLAMAAAIRAERIDVDLPKWDQSTFLGRLKHFFSITDPRTALCSETDLDNASKLLSQYRIGTEPPGTTEEQIRYAQKLYLSAFHPDTGDKMNVVGRMSFQVPGGMLITGCLLQFYKTVPQVVFWQWVNQSFNAFVNYTNRNAKSDVTNKQIGVAYASATTTATIVSVALNSLTRAAPPLIARFVPFAAVASANCVNIPLMRQRELTNGIAVYDENGEFIGHSKRAAVKGITQVVTSRITMAAPGMLIIPIIMEKLEKYRFMQRIRILHAPIQILMCGVSLVFMVPIGCAMFPQKCSLSVDHLEPEMRLIFEEKTGHKHGKVFFNKGL